MARLSVISKQFALVTSWLCPFACGRLPAIRRAAVLILGLLVVAGCLPGGGQATPVPTGGVITFNGEVVAGAYVLFIPETGPQASATTDAEGGFELTTVKAKDGVVPGKCRIAIEKREPADPKNPYVDRKSLIPERYGSVKDSGLVENVEAKSENYFAIDLKK